MRLWNSLGLAARTSALLIIVLALLSAMAGTWIAAQQEQVARQRFEDRATKLVNVLARTDLRAATADAGSAATLLRVLAVAGSVIGFGFVDDAGKIYHRRGNLPASLPTGLDSTHPVWASHRLWVMGSRAGAPNRTRRIILGFKAADLDPAWKESVPTALSAAILAASLILLVVLQVMVSRPLKRLRAFAEALGHGDMDAVPPRVPGPEASALGTTLREMAREIEGWRVELEGRVRVRTRELEVALSESTAAREERAEALQRLQAIVDSMADGVIFVNASNQVVLTNQAARHLRNLRDGQPRPLAECHSPGSQRLVERVLGYLRQGDDAGGPHPIIKEDDGRFETTYAPVTDAAGEYMGVVMVTRDIRERCTLERRLLDAERLATVGQMAAQVAHELRNPLNAIAGAAQYLTRVLPSSPEVSEYGGLIRDEVQRVNRFVADLLNVARPTEPVFVVAALGDIVREATRRAVLAHDLSEDAVELALTESLPSLELDPKLIMQALVNLIDNALEAGGNAPPEVHVRYEEEAAASDVVVEIADRGSGIPDADLADVIRPFSTTKANGTGLGLVIVDRAVDQHRATWRLIPRPGGGTIAQIRFPVRSLHTE